MYTFWLCRGPLLEKSRLSSDIIYSETTYKLLGTSFVILLIVGDFLISCSLKTDKLLIELGV